MITICIPTYNSSAYIMPCLNSVRRQKGKYKVIIRDDGSFKDDTSAIVKGYIKRHQLPWVFVKGGHLGGSLGRKALLDMVDTSHVLFVDSDDKLVGDEVILKTEALLDEYDVVYLNSRNKWGLTNRFTGDMLMDSLAERVDGRINNVYKVELLRNIEWYRPTYGEVRYINIAVLLQKPKYVWIEEHLYYCRLNRESTVHSTGAEETKLSRAFYTRKVFKLLVQHGVDINEAVRTGLKIC